MASKSEGAFPAAYAALLSAFYLPLVLMLCALILRGVSFEFRYKAAHFVRFPRKTMLRTAKGAISRQKPASGASRESG